MRAIVDQLLAWTKADFALDRTTIHYFRFKRKLHSVEACTQVITGEEIY